MNLREEVRAHSIQDPAPNCTLLLLIPVGTEMGGMLWREARCWNREPAGHRCASPRTWIEGESFLRGGTQTPLRWAEDLRTNHDKDEF